MLAIWSLFWPSYFRCFYCIHCMQLRLRISNTLVQFLLLFLVIFRLVAPQSFQLIEDTSLGRGLTICIWELSKPLWVQRWPHWWVQGWSKCWCFFLKRLSKLFSELAELILLLIIKTRQFCLLSFLPLGFRKSNRLPILRRLIQSCFLLRHIYQRRGRIELNLWIWDASCFLLLNMRSTWMSTQSGLPSWLSFHWICS